MIAVPSESRRWGPARLFHFHDRLVERSLVTQSDAYRGFTLMHDCPPIPIRSFDWSAAPEDYDASWEAPKMAGRKWHSSSCGDAREAH